jgi:hypothetical protein
MVSSSGEYNLHRKSGKKYPCEMDPNKGKRRKTHAILMENLINNTLQIESNDSEGAAIPTGTAMP